MSVALPETRLDPHEQRLHELFAELAFPDRMIREPKGWTWGQENSFVNARGASLPWACVRNHEKPLANVVYVAGLGQTAPLTFELAADLDDRGCNFFVFDRHGQGLAPRLLKDRFKVHSTGFAHDREDVAQFIDEHVPDDAPVILLGHSAGGLKALRFSATDEGKKRAQGVCATAPFTGIHPDVFGYGLEKAFALMFPFPWLMESYALLGAPKWTPLSDPASPKPPEFYSSDPVRRHLIDYIMMNYEAARVGGMTHGWIQAACSEIVDLRNPKVYGQINLPIVVITAGEDHLVDNKPTFDLIERIPSNYKRRQHLEDSCHNVLLGRDPHRETVLNAVHGMAYSLNR